MGLRVDDEAIRYIDEIIATDGDMLGEAFVNCVTIATVKYGGTETAMMLRRMADVMENANDLHEAYKMRYEVLGDLGQL